MYALIETICNLLGTFRSSSSRGTITACKAAILIRVIVTDCGSCKKSQMGKHEPLSSSIFTLFELLDPHCDNRCQITAQISRPVLCTFVCFVSSHISLHRNHHCYCYHCKYSLNVRTSRLQALIVDLASDRALLSNDIRGKQHSKRLKTAQELYPS